MKADYFPKAHLWLLIPFLITLTGFYWSYWSVMGEVPFRHHAHGLTATAWYILLIAQPWIANYKSIQLHRKVGFIGLLLAGGVMFSAIQNIPYNIINLPAPVLKYGLSFYDFGVLLGFGISVVMAMLNSRNTPKHARWMISTAFWALQPAFFRLVFVPMAMNSDGPPPLSFVEVLYLCMAVTFIPLLIMIYLDYRKEKKVYAPYVLVLFGVALLTVLVEVMGNTGWWIDWCNNVLAGGLS